MKLYFRLLTLISLTFSGTVTAQPVLLDKIAVIVNDQIITESQILNEIAARQRQLSSQNRSQATASIRDEVTQQLINEVLQMQQAQRQNITIDNLALDREIERIAQRQGGTVEQLFNQLTANGEDYVEFREEIRQQMAIQQTFVREVRREVKISEQEISDYLNSDIHPRLRNAEYQLSLLTLPLSENADAAEQEATLEQADTLYQRLIAGENFAQLALQYSQDSSARDRGDLGWLTRGQLPNRFMEAIVTMNIGDISTPFITTNAVNILQFVGIRGIDNTIVDEVNAKHILIQPSEIKDEASALNEITALRERILAGEDFAELAEAYSDDSVSASLGGELNWAPSTNYVSAFKRVVDSLPLNTLSEPFQSVFGWHIVSVTARRQVNLTMSTLREQAEIDLLNLKSNEQQDLWIARLRNNAFIEIRD